ncbi:PadR family transcriptional regulator [Methanobacterium alcaliphilum]|uniref:PadR family transcriptional regulator n=1 Tax=Methanobacterium alcaliphilum TaxID=392018 RepID=UPI00200A3168|nr:PadR family transcriptional regulator [Methanobacterium alcaliphilum]MCK9151698.1 PadR family transcriptional regulator [Methanobacterium alcaliphilum]
MVGLLRFTSIDGKEVRLLTLFILHTLNDKPCSGYDLIKAMQEKTSGGWTPSKGTIYPLLKQLQEEKLIKVSEIGKRSRTIFEITPQGKKLLYNIRKTRKESRKKFSQFRDLFNEMFGEEETKLNEIFFKIQTLIKDIPPEKEEDIVVILEKCILELKNL